MIVGFECPAGHRRLAKAPKLRHSRAEQERSSVAETLESIPLPRTSGAAEQNSAPPRRVEVTEWILGSALRRFAPCSARG
ncbi:hypothetical protein MPLDJ20_190040 [Mesorhizobium plurifarium]|uniref:Uncharacterized protein n=1 Tax=Mesorhizobium plurifarium TaxID=69974 RepID=A0A090EYR1_MESPL|nr:hypothetical protein MPLDJ20_190040 [Mesorhizobium plurifarium]